MSEGSGGGGSGGVDRTQSSAGGTQQAGSTGGAGAVEDGGSGGQAASPALAFQGFRHDLYDGGSPWVVNAAVHGTSPSDVYVAGYVDDLPITPFGTSFLGFVDHWDGKSWQPLYETGRSLLGVWAASDSLAFAVGDGMIVRLEAGQPPVEFTPAGMFMGVWGSGPNDVVAVGFGGLALHYDGQQWLTESSGTAADLRAVWGTDPDNVIAVGKGGALVRRSGGVWQPMDSGTTLDLNGVWASGPGDVYAVGGSELSPGHVILHYDGTGWSTVQGGDTRLSTLLGVWGTSRASVDAVGAYRDSADNPHAELFHFDGAAWHEIPIAVDEFLWDIWCATPGDCVLVGPDDTLIRMAR
jgi:hypothetical protein